MVFGKLIDLKLGQRIKAKTLKIFKLLKPRLNLTEQNS